MMTAHGETAAIESAYAANVDRHDIVVCRSKVMLDVIGRARAAASGDCSVLITGETGTGKEVLANLLHELSPRRTKPFIVVSCAALSESLIESELFGHEEGAFTGATHTKVGRIELARGGTLFLDDVDDVPFSIQPKLLRVLQTRRLERVGGSKSLSIDFRVIGATKRDLRELAEAGLFRPDLYYRLNVLNIYVPPLRQRVEDIPELARHFVRRACTRRGMIPVELPNALVALMCQATWPGNVRELENACERLVQLWGSNCSGPEDVFTEHRSRMTLTLPTATDDFKRTLDERLRDLESDWIARALKHSRGNKAQAAALLGLKRSTLNSRIRRLGIVGRG